MTPERLAEIIADAQSRGGMRTAAAGAFREAVERDWQGAATAEHEEYVGTIHGRRAPKTELQRIEREITREHEQRWRDDVERALTLDGYAHGEEVPTLQQYARECSEAPSAAEAYEAVVSDRGSADRPLMLALLEQVTRTGIRAELARMGPGAALELYRRAIAGTDVGPDAVVRRAVLVQEIERRGDDWPARPIEPSALPAEHAAARELARLIADTRAARVPREVQEALTAAEQAQQYAARMRQVHKLQVRPLDEVLGPADPAAAERAAKLVKGRRSRGGGDAGA